MATGTLPTDSESASLSADKDLTEEQIVKELTEEEKMIKEYWQPNAENLLQYVKLKGKSTNTTLFSFLALLNMYVPESYLLPSQCQEVLGPPDPIHGGPPFEERMKPFTVLIHTLTPETSEEDKRVQFIHPVIARRSVQLLHKLGFSRSNLVKNFMTRFSGDHTKPHMIQFIKDLLTKRELGDKGRRNNFSKLIEDILNNENFHKSESVLLIASNNFKTFPLFPQCLARLNYIKGCRYDQAEKWATEAIWRAPKNSYVADTLGQVHKNSLLRKRNASDTEVLDMANRAMKAFKAVCDKAEKEVKPEMEDTGVASYSNIFNNRGLFGCNQVAKIIFDQLTSGRNGEAWRNTLIGNATSYPASSLQRHSSLISNLKSEVKDKYHFFEWYLTYSRFDSESLEPSYFWKDVVLCYQKYTNEPETQPTTFPAIFDCLYHGLYTSKGRHAGFEETAKTTSVLETMLSDLEHSYKACTTDVGHAERYILSNLIVSNKVPDSPKLTPIKDLQMIICSFLADDLRHRSPEFYLLALLLFWPDKQQLSVYHDEEEDGKGEGPTKVEQNKTWEDEESNGSDTEQQTLEDVVQLLSLDSVMNHDLNDYVSFMEDSFQEKYAKYLRGRYLLPLFFLGKGDGLSKWVHKSRLDVILEAEAKIQEDSDKRTNNIKQRKTRQNRIDEMWNNRHVWQIREVQDILLPVQGEASSQSAPNEVFACTGGKKIRVQMQDDPPTSVPNSTFFLYLGFSIQGPVAFNMGPPCK